MRTAFLLLGTMLLLAAGFAGYWYVQSRDPANAAGDPATDPAVLAALNPAKPLEEGDSVYTVRGGTDVWLKQFDESGRRTSQFRAEEFNPQKEGFVRVKNPEAHFFLKGGQWIRVIGKTGDVVISGMQDSGSEAFTTGTSGMGGAAPSRGSLKDVRIQLYETADSKTPTLDMDMNNAAFDNDSFRIATEAYTDETGKLVSADQVKVTVRGEYEFDGHGLVIKWNDRDRRLDLLEVAHGERLVVKDPGALGDSIPGKKSKPATQVQPQPQVRAFPADAVLLASADKASAAGVAATQANAKDESTLYEIWLYDNVQVVQEDQTLATGSVIQVFYAMRDSEESATTAPTSGDVAKTQAAASGADASTATTNSQASQQSTQSAQTQPTTQPEEKQAPITVYWTGKLRIVPATTAPPAPLPPGESAVQMRGAPLALTRDNVRIRCPQLTYLTADGQVKLENSEPFPQVEIEQFAKADRAGKPEVTLLSEWVTYAPDDGIATLGGKSRAVFPADESKPAGEPALATWNKQAVARLTSAGGEETIIENLELTGDVDVQHPQLSLKSQRLSLAFDPPAPAPAVSSEATAAATTKPTGSRQPLVRKVIADEKVQCVLIDEDGAARELNSDHLEITTGKDSNGKPYPSIVNARGNVTGKDQDSELSAHELAMLLVPAPPKPGEDAKAADKKVDTSARVALKKMVAKTNVRAVSKEGDVATGDALVVTMSPEGEPQVGLSGKPAKVTNVKGTELASEKIVFLSNDEARAIGPGTLHAVVEDKDAAPGTPPQVMDVSWTDSALVNNKLPEHQVQLAGKVKSEMIDEEGYVNTASADRILITLVDKPPAPADPKAKPANKRETKKKETDGGALARSDVDVMKDKQVSRILLNKDAVVNSRLSAADGSVLREMQISSSLVQYTMTTRRLAVPRPGTMIVRDHRPPEEKAVVASDRNKEESADEDGLSSERGATAFRWSKSLNYDGAGATPTATMKGDVIVAYKPDAEGDPPVQLRSDEVVATFQQAKPKAAPPPRGEKAPKTPQVELRSVRAEGNVLVVRSDQELTTPRLTYDPISHWIRATGTDSTPPVFTSGQGGSTMSGRQLEWNTKTWKMRVTDAAVKATPR